MANNVILQVMGGGKAVHDGINTVADAKRKLGIDNTYTAAVNGDPASDSTELTDSAYVTFSKSVKGGQ